MIREAFAACQDCLVSLIICPLAGEKSQCSAAFLHPPTLVSTARRLALRIYRATTSEAGW